MGLIYDIENGAVTISGHTDKTVKSIIIPEFIDDLPVRYIDQRAFTRNCFLENITIPKSVIDIPHNALFDLHLLEYINGWKIENNFYIINNSFIYDNTIIHKIISQISDDYICMCNGRYRFFVNNIKYYDDFCER